MSRSRLPRVLNERQRALARIIATKRNLRSQPKLREELASLGYEVSQPQISRDLYLLLDEKAPGPPYVLKPEYQLRFGQEQLVKDLERSRKVTVHPTCSLVIKTEPGLSHLVAKSLKDHSDDVLGTICGDDVVLVLAKDRRSRRIVADLLRSMLPSGEEKKEIDSPE